MEIDYKDEMTIETEEQQKKKNDTESKNHDKNIFNSMAFFHDCYCSFYHHIGKRLEIFFKLKEK